MSISVRAASVAPVSSRARHHLRGRAGPLSRVARPLSRREPLFRPARSGQGPGSRLEERGTVGLDGLGGNHRQCVHRRLPG